MKKYYRVQFDIKSGMKQHCESHYLMIYANNQKDALKQCGEAVYQKTGKHAFHKEILK